MASFHDNQGNMLELDTTGWTEWGSQPYVYSEDCYFGNHLGRWGGLTATGGDPDGPR